MSLELVAIATLLTLQAHADAITSTWNGGTGAWSTASNWTPAAAPSNDATNTYSVLLDGGKTGITSSVTLASTASISALTIDAGDSLTVSGNVALTIASPGSTANNGKFSLVGPTSGSPATLAFTGASTLAGSGTLTLAYGSLSGTSNATLTLDASQTIGGSGTIHDTLPLINHGTIIANYPPNGAGTSTADLAIVIPTTTALLNTGALQASNGASLNLGPATTFTSVSLDNTGGTISATGTKSLIYLNCVNVSNGTLTAASGGSISAYGSYGSNLSSLSNLTVNGSLTLANTALTNVTFNGPVTEPSASNICNLSGTITNNNTWTVGSSSPYALKLNSSVTLAGTGNLVLNGALVASASTGLALSIAAGATISGDGTLGYSGGVTLTNHGTINANHSTGSFGYTLTVGIASGSTLLNDGTLEASNVGVLMLSRSIDNTSGSILATGTNSQVQLWSASISNGTLTATAGGSIVSFDGTSAISNATVNGQLTISATLNLTATTLSGPVTQNRNITAGLSGMITNNGTWTQTAANSIAPASKAIVSGYTTLAGSGSFIMAGGNLYGTTTADSLIIGAGQTISGFGNIGYDGAAGGTLTLTNHGTVNANSATVPLALYPRTTINLINDGLLKATGSGKLDFINATVNNAGGNMVAIDVASQVRLSNSTITSGNLNTGGAGLLISYAGTNAITSSIINGSLTVNTGTSLNLTSVTITGVITQNAPMSIAGTITNNGTWFNATTIAISGPSTLTGSGTLVLGGDLYAANATDRLTIASNATLSDFGYIGFSDPTTGGKLALTNHGTINANASSAGPGTSTILTLCPTPGSTLINDGAMKATNGGTLIVQNALVDSTAGSISADNPGSLVKLDACQITNGNFTATNGGAITFTGGTTLSGAPAATIGSGSSLATGSVATTFGAVANAGPFTLSAAASVATIQGTFTTPSRYTGTTSITAGTLTADFIRQDTLAIATGAAARFRESTTALANGWPGGDNARASIIRTLSLAGTATLDVANNDLILDYTGNTSPAADIEAMVRSAYNHGTWTGNGLTSSTTAARNIFTLLVIDNATLGLTSFDGVTIPSTAVIVKFTHQDDLNASGDVTAADTAIFNANYAAYNIDTGTVSPGHIVTHAQGDMDFDGVLTFNDAQLFALYYNESLAHLPEPASLAVLAFGATAGFLVRRKK